MDKIQQAKGFRVGAVDNTQVIKSQYSVFFSVPRKDLGQSMFTIFTCNVWFSVTNSCIAIQLVLTRPRM